MISLIQTFSDVYGAIASSRGKSFRCSPRCVRASDCRNVVSELEAAVYLTNERTLNEVETKMVARTFAAGFEQIHHLQRELVLMAIKEEMEAAEVEA